MKNIQINKLRKSVERALNRKRFEHTLGVAYTAASLAMINDENIEKALTAGLLHDCAKCLSTEKLIALCEKHNLHISDTERANPSLLHAKVGSLLTMKKYHIYDNDIINAILNHTTGRPEMSKLEKIIYVADYIEPSRTQIPNLDTVRKLAFDNLDQAFLSILESSLKHINASSQPIDIMTQKTYDYYKDLMNKGEKNESINPNG